MKTENDKFTKQLTASWESNAGLWTDAVRNASIPSRSAGTDQAIVDAIKQAAPQSIIDIGCGEGWLVRRIRDELNCRVVGVDGSARLVDNAKTIDPAGHYVALGYDALDDLPADARGPFDVAVCNFALLGEALRTTLQAIRKILANNGLLIIQTLHPWVAADGQAYRDGWREERFASFSSAEWQSMPWYFRTLESWLREIDAAGMDLVALREPVNETTAGPLSIVLVCKSK